MKIKTRFTTLLLIALGVSITIFNSCKKPKDPLTDVDGNVYKTVNIGTQVWMAENLKVTKYRNGDLIETTDPSELNISDEPTPKYQWAYNGDESNVDIYGRLYTWYVVDDSRGVCPAGWHVPTDGEWTTLSGFLGGPDFAGGNLKETGTSHWTPPNEGATDQVGFIGLPAGSRYPGGLFGNMYDCAYWWTTHENSPEYGWYYAVFFGTVEFYRDHAEKSMAHSIRCIKDY